MLEIFREAARCIENGRRAALATIIGTHGSTPGKESAKLLIRDDGSTVGTIGGGCSEAEVWRAAMEVIATDECRRMSFRLTAATAAETGLLCGGSFEVYIEPIGHPVVFVFGAGHLARSLARTLAPLEYGLVIVDDREQYAAPQHFPGGTRTLVRSFDDCMSDLGVGPSSFVVIVTRGHQHDENVLEQALRTPARYIGLIGSRGKIGAICKNLQRRGVSSEALRNIYAPIGYEIGARTPDEIAIAIAAQIIAVRRGCAPPPNPPIAARDLIQAQKSTQLDPSRSAAPTWGPRRAPDRRDDQAFSAST